MKLKTILLTLALATICTAVQAEDRLTFRQSDGTTQSFALDGLKLTFDEGNLIVKNNTQEATFALSTMAAMYFEDAQTGIASPQQDIDVTLEEGGKVYTLDGRKVASSLSGLPAGVYVVKQGSQTKKVLVQ